MNSESSSRYLHVSTPQRLNIYVTDLPRANTVPARHLEPVPFRTGITYRTQAVWQVAPTDSVKEVLYEDYTITACCCARDVASGRVLADEYVVNQNETVQRHPYSALNGAAADMDGRPVSSSRTSGKRDNNMLSICDLIC